MNLGSNKLITTGVEDNTTPSFTYTGGTVTFIGQTGGYVFKDGVTYPLSGVNGSLLMSGQSGSFNANISNLMSNFYLSTSITSFSLPNLSRVFGDCTIYNTTSINFLNLKNVFGKLEIGSSGLITINLDNLITTNTLYISASSLTTLSLPSLTTVNGFCQFSGNALTTLSLPSLTSVQNYFRFSGQALTTLSLPSLTSIGAGYEVSNNTNLVSISTPNLIFIGTVQLQNNNALTSVSFPSLTTIANNFDLNSNTVLTSFSLPSIVDLANLGIAGNTLLTSFSLGSTLKIVDGWVTINGALNQASVDNVLIRLAALNGTNGTTSYNSKTVSIVGTSATPSSAGLAAKATLISRGCTVTTN